MEGTDAHSRRPAAYVEIIATAFLRKACTDASEPAKGGGRQIKTLVGVLVFPTKKAKLTATLKEEAR